MKCNIPKVLRNTSFICRYQIVLDDTSITVHKPTLWAIRISPVTPLYPSQSEMSGIKSQLASGRCCSLHRQPRIATVSKRQVKTLHHQQPHISWVENPLSPDNTKFLQLTGVYKKCSSRGINLSRSFPNPSHNVGINMNRKCDLTTGPVVWESMGGQPK